MPILITSPRGLIGRHFTWKTGTPPRWLTILTPIVLNTLLGFYPVILKSSSMGQDSSDQKVNPFVFTFYRCLGAFPVLLTGSYLVEGPFPIPDLRMTLVFLSFGFLGVFVGQFTYIAGAFLLPADNVSAFQPLIAIWTSILSVVMCTEPVPSFSMLHSWAKIVGIIVAAGGAAKLALAGYNLESDQSTSHSSRQTLGYFCLLVDTVSAAIFYVLQKIFVFNAENCIWKEYPMAVTGYAYLFGTMFDALFCSYYLFSGQTQAFLLPKHSLAGLVYAVFIVSALCYFLITWTNKYLPSSILTAFFPMQVLSTAVTAFLILGDTLTYTQLFSASAIIGGLCLVIYSNRVDERMSRTGEGGVRLDSCLRRAMSNDS